MRTHMDIDMKNPDIRVPAKDDKMIKHITNNCSAQQLCVLSCTESSPCFQQKQNRNKTDSQQNKIDYDDRQLRDLLTKSMSFTAMVPLEIRTPEATSPSSGTVKL